MRYRYFPLIFVLVMQAVHAGNEGGVWYAGLALGKSQVEDFSNNSVRHDFILGWRATPHATLEASYINLGRHDNPYALDPILSINGFGGAVLGLFPLAEQHSLLLRLGLQKLDIEHDYEGYEPKLSRIVGLGGEWALERRWLVRLEFQHIAGITDRHATGKYEAISLVTGLYYCF